MTHLIPGDLVYNVPSTGRGFPLYDFVGCTEHYRPPVGYMSNVDTAIVLARVRGKDAYDKEGSYVLLLTSAGLLGWAEADDLVETRLAP